MENFKIQNFKKEYPNIDFPSFHELTLSEIKDLHVRLYMRAGIDESVSKKSLTYEINKIEKVTEYNATSDNFKINEIFKSLEIMPKKSVYINWYHYDLVDKFDCVDIIKYFDDIWYPSADDIDIFDDTFSWIISIAHDGEIKMVKFE